MKRQTKQYLRRLKKNLGEVDLDQTREIDAFAIGAGVTSSDIDNLSGLEKNDLLRLKNDMTVPYKTQVAAEVLLLRNRNSTSDIDSFKPQRCNILYRARGK